MTGHLTPNYAPLPVSLVRGEGVWLWDAAGRRYLDALAAYSAVNFGHRHPYLVAAAQEQLGRLTLVSRAFEHPLLDPFADRLCALSGTEMMLPMNTGAEAVESAIKAARRHAHAVRGIAPDAGRIVVAAGNFHGRTTTIVSFSSDAVARDGFGPFTPGFTQVPYGDVEALRAAMGPDVVAVLLEPVQGEAGIHIPPAHYLPAARAACDEWEALLILDEIQSGLGRCGVTFAWELTGARPDLMTLGKALGGGIVPVSAVVGSAQVLGLLTPGTHGSTFGGNPLACAVGLAVLDLVETGEYQQQANVAGAVLDAGLARLERSGLVQRYRRVGLWAGVDVAPRTGTARDVCLRMVDHGVLAKDTHGQTVRLAPPLCATEADIATLLASLEEALTSAP